MTGSDETGLVLTGSGCAGFDGARFVVAAFSVTGLRNGDLDGVYRIAAGF